MADCADTERLDHSAASTLTMLKCTTSHTHTHTQCITMHEELHWKMQVLKKLFQQMMVIQNREMEHDSHLKELVCSEVRCLYREP